MQYITAETVTILLGVLAILAFMVNVIVEMTKGLPGITRIPTKAWCLLISMLVCVISVLIYMAYMQITILWYYIVLAILGAFVVGYLAMYGWDTLKELWDRYKIKK